MDNIADLLDSLYTKKEKKERVIRSITAVEAERAATAVNKALEMKSLMTYGKFWSYVTGQPKNKFRPSDLLFTIKLAESVTAGGSALLVNVNGKYGGKAPAEQHRNFLKQNEYAEEIIEATK